MESDLQTQTFSSLKGPCYYILDKQKIEWYNENLAQAKNPQEITVSTWTER